MAKKIILEGAPQSTNHLYKHTCFGNRPRVYMDANGKAMKESYQWQVKSQWKENMIVDNIELEIDLYFKDRRRRDWDNYHKITMDAMEDIVFKDDSQIQKTTVIKHIDKENPRTEIIIKKLK